MQSRRHKLLPNIQIFSKAGLPNLPCLCTPALSRSVVCLQYAKPSFPHRSQSTHSDWLYVFHFSAVALHPCASSTHMRLWVWPPCGSLSRKWPPSSHISAYCRRGSSSMTTTASNCLYCKVRLHENAPAECLPSKYCLVG